MNFPGMRSLLLATIVATGLACRAQAELVPVDDFSGLVLWAGEGENEAAFVLQFSASQVPTSVAWGYRWSGTATMQAMMDAIAGTTTITDGSSPPPGLDGRLSVAMTYYPQYSAVFIDSIAYDQAGLPSPWTQATRLIADDYFQSGTYPVLYTRSNAGGLWLGEGESQGMTFAYSLVGASDIELTPGGWYGWVQSTGAETFAFTQPVAAVPEPGTWALAGGAVAAAAAARTWRRRR
jgi:hypothetical protein